MAYIPQILPVKDGGTNNSTLTTNSLIYASSSSQMSSLPIFNNGIVETNSIGVPSISTVLPPLVQSNITATGNLGNQLNTTRTAFAVRQNVGAANNVTGDGTVATIPFGTTIFDQGGNFSGSTFTAPVTGIYHFDVTITISGLTISFTDMFVNLVTTARSVQFSSISPGKVFETNSGSSTFLITGGVTIPMTSGDTATVTVAVFGSTKSISLLGGSSLTTAFSGFLVC
jgi:hypothetical protein